MRDPNHTAKVQQGFFIHLILAEQVGVIAEITEKPVQFPERSFGAIQPTGEWSPRKWFGLEDDKSHGQERLLRMPAVGRGIDSNQEKAFEKIFAILLPGMQAGNVSFHGFASTGWA